MTTYDAVASHFPQSWNRYAYVRNSPLELIDPFGLQCQPVSKLNLDGKDKNAQASGDNFGPYDPGDEYAEQQAGGGCSPGQCLLDGADVDCSMLGVFEAEGGGPLGGGSPSVLSSYQCLWADCMGAAGQIDQWGNPVSYNYLPLASDGCGEDPANNQYKCQVSTNIAGLNGPQVAPELMASCGWDPFCGVWSGIVNATMNNRPSGALEAGAAVLTAGATAGVGSAFAPEIGAAASSAFDWTVNVAFPTAQEYLYELSSNPYFWAAAVDCGTQFIRDSPPPVEPVGVLCNRIHRYW